MILQKVESNTYTAPLHITFFLKPGLSGLPTQTDELKIDRSLQYGRAIPTPLSACPTHSLSQPIMASGKVANCFCGLTNKARNVILLFVFTDGIQVCY
jgi:hypothetical protein